MSKLLELIGFGLIGLMFYTFIGPIAQKDPMGWPLFWSCAIATLAIIIYRKQKKKKELAKD